MPNHARKSTTHTPGMQEGMAEATRLTNAGRLSEATAAIQRALGSPLGGTLAGNMPGPVRSATHTTEDRPTATKPDTKPDTDALVSRLMNLPDSLTRDVLRKKPSPGEGQRVQAPEPEAPATGGRFVAGSYTNRAGTRGYKLYIPSGATGPPLPLVVMLHGCTQSPDDFAAGTRMNTLAESGDFYVVYPEQTGSANMSKCWNWFNEGDQQRDRGEPSIIAGITHQIAATQPVDTRRIYVAGMSAGAAMAVVLGETYPELYATVGVHSGLAYGAAHDLPSAFGAMQGGGPDVARNHTPEAVDLGLIAPVIVFHGDRDGTVHQRNAEQVLNQRLSGLDEPRATVRRGQVRGGRSYTHSVYRDSGGKTVAERWIVHGAGHAWSGGSPKGSYTDPDGPDASMEMVRFFMEHPRR